MTTTQISGEVVQGKVLWTGRDRRGKQPVARITVSEGPHKGKKVFVYLTNVQFKSKVRIGDALSGEIHQNGKKNNGRTRFILKKPQLV